MVHVGDIHQDADTLFFQRRLQVTGDTELGLAVRNLLDQRELAVAGKPYTIQAGGPGNVEEMAARVLAAAHDDLETIATMQHQLGANRYGWAASEIDWDVRTIDGRDWVVPVWFANVPARRFRIDTRLNELRLTTEASPQGEPLRPGKWMVTTRPGSLARAALLRTAVWPALWKSFSARDWLVYAEMFGVPLVQAIYQDLDTGGDGATDDSARATAEEIVRRLGSSGGAVTPKSVEVKIHETRGADNCGTHGALIALAGAWPRLEALMASPQALIEALCDSRKAMTSLLNRKPCSVA